MSLASKYVIPESVWQDGNWQTNEPLNTANNGAHSEDLSGFSPPPMSMILDMEPASASTTGKETWQVLTPRVLDEGGADFLLADQIESELCCIYLLKVLIVDPCSCSWRRPWDFFSRGN